MDNTDAGKLLSRGEISSVPQSVDERRDFIQQIPRRIVSEGRRVCPSVNTYALPPKTQTFVAPLLGGNGGLFDWNLQWMLISGQSFQVVNTQEVTPQGYCTVLVDRQELSAPVESLERVEEYKPPVALSRLDQVQLKPEIQINGRDARRRVQTVPRGAVVNIRGLNDREEYALTFKSDDDEEVHLEIPRETLDNIIENQQAEVIAQPRETVGNAIVELEVSNRHTEPITSCDPSSSLHTEIEQFDEEILFENCHSGNDYMEVSLNDPSFQSRASRVNQALSDYPEMAACINNSLKKGGKRNIDPGVCSNGETLDPVRERGKLISPVKSRACASKLLTGHMTDAFMKVSNCLGVDAKELFPLINHESRFQPGAISYSFASSVGQVTTDNYIDIIDNLNAAQGIGPKSEMAKLFKEKLQQPQSENCNSLNELASEADNYFDDISNEGGDRSVLSAKRNQVITNERERFCGPANPERGLLIAGLYYIANKRKTAGLLSGRGIASPLNKEMNTTLSRWMFNVGQTGVSKGYKTFIKSLAAGNVAKRDKDLNIIPNGGFYPSGSTLATFLNSSSPLDDFKKYMSVYIMNRHKGAARKAEVANYIRGGIDGDIKKIDAQVEPNSAGSCGE